LKNQPRPEDDDESEEQAQQQNFSQTESDEAFPEEADQINSSTAKKFKRASEKNAPS
jgi:hypothetical protein